MSDDGYQAEEEEVAVLFEQESDVTSVEPPAEEWSSLLCWLAGPSPNIKYALYAQGLYQPPSEEICAKYIALSDSSIYRHPYYPFPAVTDPGIEEALLHPAPKTIYSDDGQELYLDLCKAYNECPCKLFYNGLLEESIDLSYYGISANGWRPMAYALKNNRSVKSINFKDNFISNDGCFHFGEILIDNFALKEINFNGCRMGPAGARRLFHNMHKNRTLAKLNLSRNRLGDEGMEIIGMSVYKGAKVSNLNLSNNGITSKGANYLSEALEYNNIITHLDFSWNSLLVPKIINKLISRLLFSEKFVEINLAWNSLNSRLTKPLSDLLLIPNIQSINLSNNTLNEEVIAGIVRNIPKAKKLQVLNLSYNPFPPASALNVLTTLGKRVVKLKEVYMDGVTVTQEFVEKLNKFRELKYRKDLILTHGDVQRKSLIMPPDMREILLTRAQFLCSKPKKKAVHIGEVILTMNKEMGGQPIPQKELKREFSNRGAFQMNEGLCDELCTTFPGPKKGKIKSCDIELMAEYVHRKWPEAKPFEPPPPPEPEPPKDAKKGAKIDAKDAKKGKKK